MHHSLILPVQHRRTLGRWAILLVLLSLLFVPGTLKAQSNLTLTIASTSEPDSSDTEDGSAGNERPVLIGEVVTFSLVFEIAEGTSNNVNAVVSIPDGLEYIANSQSLSFTNDTGWSDTVSVSGGGSSGADVTFDFGTVTNTDSDANTETIEIEFDVVVSNIAANQDGSQLTTNATLNANGSTADTSEDRIVEVVEPDLTVEKQQRDSFNGSQITSGDAGDDIHYRIFVTNNGDAPAYDVNLTDVLPLDYVDVVFCCTTTGPSTGAAVTSNPSPGPWGFYWTEIPAGVRVSVTVRVAVSDNTAPGELWTNTAVIDYSSLPGTNGTGNATPGGAGTDTGERNNADGQGGAVDNYEVADTSDTLTVPDVELVKQIEHPINTPVANVDNFSGGTYVDSTDDPNTGTSEHDADNVDLAIGEEFNYIITVTVPEGTTYDLTMIDLASPNNQTGGRQNRVIELLSAEVIHVGANLTLGGGLGGVGTTFNLVDNDGSDGDADRFQAFTGGGRNVFNNPDNVENDDDRYVIRVTARLDDEDAGQYNGGASNDHNDSNVQNRDGDIAQNKVQLQWRDQDNNQTTQNPPSTGFANNDMVEPDVQVTATTNTTGDIDAGDTVQFTLTVANVGTAPAYNIFFNNNYPTDFGNELIEFASIDTATSTCDDISGWVVSNVVTDQTQFQFDELLAGTSCTIVLNTTVQGEVEPNETYTMSVTDLSYSSTPQGFTEDDNRSYEGNTETATFTIAEPTIAKSYLATSEDHTDSGDTRSGANDANEIPLAIGEIIRYQLNVTLIEGVHDSLTVSDALPAGLEAIYDSNFTVSVPGSVSVGTAGLTSGATTAIYNDDGSTAVSGFNSGSNTSLALNFGTVTNSNTNNATAETIVIEFNALVLNNNPSDQNDRNDQRDNDAAFDVDSGVSTGSSNTLHARIYEPQVTLTKTANPSEGNVGDTVTFTLTVTNDNNAQGATAFDLNLVDTLPTEYSNLTVTSIPGGATDNSSGTTLDVDIPSLAQNATATIIYTAQLNNTIVPDQDIINTADLTYSSLPGNFGTTSNSTGSSLSELNTNQGGHTSGADDGERNGNGTNPNDYTDSDSATVTADNITLTKAIASTSESHTTGQNVAIGEVITFELITSLPEGSLTDLVLTDTLPTGLTFIDGTVSLYTINAGSVTFTDVSGSVPGSIPGLTLPADTGGAPTNAGTYRYDSGTGTLEINLGDIANGDDDADVEEAVIRFEVVVANTSSNDLGDSWSNQASAALSVAAAVTSNAVNVTVQEPTVSVTKAVNQTLSNPTGTTTFDGGDTVVYDIVVANASSTDVTDAFDLNITDALNANLSLDSVQFVGTITGTPTDNSTTGAGGTVDVDIDQLAAGETLTIRLTTTVQNSVTLGQTISNTANLTYTSLPGAQGTGNATPGASGDAYGERNGDGGVNDYSGSHSDSFTIGGTVDAVKSIASTSESHTDDTTADTSGDPRPVAVGEVITYRLVTELPEVTSPDIVVTDTLAANIEYVTGSGRISYSADSAATGSGNYGNNETEPTTVITPTFDNGSRELSFNVGEFVNNDNDGNVEQLIIEFEALVLDDAANTLGAQWDNSYRIDLESDGTDDDTSNLVYAEIVQPELTLTKTRTDTGLVQIGDTVDFELTLTHAISSTSDAFTMIITDTLPTAGMSLDSVTGGSCSGVSTSSGSGTLTFTVPGLALTDGICTIQYTMVVGNDVEPDTTYTNTAVATYETIDGSDQRILTTNSDSASFTTLANDLAINKSVTPGNAEPGGIITYTIEFSHTGFTANNVVLTDTLPAEITIQNRDSSGDVVINNTTSNATVEVFEIAQIASGQAGIITLTAQLDNNLSAGTFFTNSVVIESTETDIDTTNNTAADSGVTVANVAPVLAPIGDQTITETTELTFTASATDNNNDTLTYGLSGEPSGASINSSSGLFSWTPTEAQGPGSYTFTVVVSDTGTPVLTDTETITVTVLEQNNAPVLDPIGDQTITETTELTFTASGNDSSDSPPNTPLTFGLSGAPSGASINSSSGLFSWTPTEAQGPGSYSFTVVVSDTGTPVLTDTETITVTVLEQNNAPVLDPIGDQTITEMTELTFTASADDSSDSPPNTPLTYGLSGAPSDASINSSSGLFSWTPTEAQGPGSYSFTVVVSDTGTPVLTDTETITVTVLEQNNAPVLDPIGDQTITETTELTFTASGNDSSDSPPNTPLTFGLSGAPSGASINSSSGLFSWTPTEAQGPGSYSFTVVVSDTGTPVLTDTETITVTVLEQNNAPVLDPIGDQTITETTELTFTASADDSSDSPPNTPLTFGLSGAPSGASINSSSGLFSWTPTEAQGPGSYSFTVVVSDTGAPVLTDTETITVTVFEAQTAPVLDPIGGQTITETNELTFTVTASDVDLPAQTLTYSLSGEPTGASINSSSGQFSWTPTNAQGPGMYTFTVIVSDTDTLTDSEEIEVTVTDLDIDYTVDVDPASLTEDNTGTQPLTFTITRDGATGFASQVDYSFGGIATTGDDYNGVSGPASFASGEVSQTVTVDILGDSIVEPDETLSLTLFDGTAPSGGLVSYTTQSITSTIINDDSAGINVISSTTPLTITEPAGTTVFTLTLTSQPTDTVSIDLTNTAPSECTLSTSSIALDSGNWQTGVEVTVTAQDNETTEGTRLCDITTEPATSSDPNYTGLDPEDVAVSVLDDDTPGVLISAASGDTTEAGGTASFTVRLQTQPTAPVTITLQSSNPDEGQIDLSEVVFTAATWNISQTVVITGVDDLVADGDQPYTIETGDTQSSSVLYDNLTVGDVAVINLDDDTASINVQPTSLTLAEPNGSEVVTITLTSQPTATVTIDFTSSDTSVCTVEPTTIEFDPTNWSESLSVTVRAVDDDEVSGERSCVISGTVSSDDTIFDTSPDIQIDVTVEDDEAPKLYLPLIVRPFSPEPDLVITDLQASSTNVQVTIRNDGTAAVTESFWVDLYIDPSRVPQYNDPWQDIAQAGVVWAIIGSDQPIAPGESRVLTLENAVQTFKGETISSSPPFPADVPVYAQVDAVNTESNFGGVQESDESNNVFGPVTSTAGLASTPPSGLQLTDPDDKLPLR